MKQNDPRVDHSQYHPPSAEPLATAASNEPVPTYDDGWWPCACVKGGNWKLMRPSTHIRINPPSSVKCNQCGCTKEDADRIAKAEAK